MVVLNEDAFIYVTSADGTDDSSNDDFQVILNTPIILPEGVKYEVALIKLHYPAKILNINDGAISYYSPSRNKIRYNRIPSGFYDSPEKFILAYKNMMGSDEEFYSLSYNEDSMLYLLNVKSGADNKQPWMQLSKNLVSFLALPPKINRQGFHAGEPGKADVTGGNSLMHIETNLSGLVHIGNKMRPVISTVTFGCGQKANNAIEYEPRNLIYCTVDSVLDIRSVSITILNDSFDEFPFVEGNVMAILHLRPSMPKI